MLIGISRSSSAFRCLSSRWSWITCANSDGVSTGMRVLPLGPQVPRDVNPFRRGFPSRVGLLRTRRRLRRRFDTVFPTPFRFVEGGIRAGDEVLAPAVLGVGGDAEAGGDANGHTFLGEDGSPLERLAGALRKASAAGGVGGRQDQRELLAAPARGDVDGPDRVAQDARKLA